MSRKFHMHFRLRNSLQAAILAIVLFAGAIGFARAQTATAANATSTATQPSGDAINALRQSFITPPDDSRMMVRWWWFGPSVTKEELERELRAMKAGGIGGVEVQPVYPLALDDPATGFHNFPYLSDEFLGDLRFASDTARELGMRFDLTLGSGWPLGGPNIPVTEAARTSRF